MKSKTEHKTLHLTLKKPQFQVTLSREKQSEFRRPTLWIQSRLIDKSYDFVKFTNGYGNDKPCFTCKFLGWRFATEGTYIYSNGLVVSVDESYFEILLGEIVQVKNVV